MIVSSRNPLKELLPQTCQITVTCKSSQSWFGKCVYIIEIAFSDGSRMKFHRKGLSKQATDICTMRTFDAALWGMRAAGWQSLTGTHFMRNPTSYRQSCLDPTIMIEEAKQIACVRGRSDDLHDDDPRQE